MTDQKIWYMHTIDGRPATYDGGQIHYLNFRGAAVLVSSLAQIRKERRASIRWRKKMGYSPANLGYGYVRVRLP